MNDFDYDMTIGDFPWGGQSNSPGNEQRGHWGSAAAGRSGSDNWPGIKGPAIDGIIEDLLRAPTRESLLAHAHALDRVLLWSHIVVPAYAEPKILWAYWDRLGFPTTQTLSGPNPAYWWYDQAKADALQAKRAGAAQGDEGGSSRLPLILALVGAAGVVVLLLRRRRAA